MNEFDERTVDLAEGDELIDSFPGMPIGNYPSSYLANLYLSEIDHGVKERLHVRHYFRYADDMVLLAPTKEELHRALDYIRGELAGIRLEPKGNWQIFPVDSRGIDFVGYVFRHTHTRLRKGVKARMRRRVNRLAKAGAKTEDIKRQLSGWWGWCKWCDSRNFIKKITKILGNEDLFGRKTVAPAAAGRRQLALQPQH